MVGRDDRLADEQGRFDLLDERGRRDVAAVLERLLDAVAARRPRRVQRGADGVGEGIGVGRWRR